VRVNAWEYLLDSVQVSVVITPGRGFFFPRFLMAESARREQLDLLLFSWIFFLLHPPPSSFDFLFPSYLPPAVLLAWPKWARAPPNLCAYEETTLVLPSSFLLFILKKFPFRQVRCFDPCLFLFRFSGADRREIVFLFSFWTFTPQVSPP